MPAHVRALRALGFATTLLALAAVGRARAATSPCATQPQLPICHGAPVGVIQPPAADPFATPQNVGALYQLDFPGGLVTTPNYRSTVAMGTDGSQVLSVENPSITMGFTIHPGSGPRDPRVEEYIWSYTLGVQVCLFSNEVAAWPSAQDTGEECSADRPVNPGSARTDWYTVGQVSEDSLPLANGGPPGTFSYGKNLSLKLQTVATTLRVHANAKLTNGHGVTPVNADSPILHIVVLPAALVQDKVLPSTILYNPPGGKSQSSLALASSYNVVTTAGKTTETDRSDAQDEWLKLEVDAGTAMGSSGPAPGALVSDLFNAPFKLSADTRWDHTVTVFNGQATTDTTAISQTCTTTFTDGIGQNDRNTVPGAAGAYQFEPFWGDKIEVMVHPQFALWDFYGVTTMQLLGTDGVCGVPPLHGISLFDLNLCANPNATAPDGSANPWKNGYPITIDERATGAVTEMLNANDCASLAALDPFYASALGQAAPLNSRGTFLLAGSYGVPGPGQADNTLMLSEAWMQSVANTHEVDQTFKTDVQDIHATEGGAGLSLSGILGLDVSVTASAGITTTTDTTSSTVYKNSTAQTTTQSTTVTGSIDDQLYRGYEPQVEFWQDDIFGTPMYRDPQAKGQPAAGG